MPDAPTNPFLSSNPVVCVDCGEVCDRASNRQIRCHECKKANHAAKQRAYRLDNPEKISALNKSYREANGDSLRERDLERYYRIKGDPEAKSEYLSAQRDRAKRRRADETPAARAARLENHRDRMAARRRSDPERFNQYSREYYAKNADKMRETAKQRYASDPIGARLSAGIRRTLRGGKGGRKWEALVGYTAEELKDHLERQFLPGMTWENRSEWHIDHILPVSSFNYDSPDHPDFKACWALTNLRPMWAKDNQKKSSKRVTII